MRKSQRFRKYNRLKVRKKRLVFKNRFFLSFVLVLIAISILFYLVCFYSLFQIKKIEISGNQKVSTDEIRSLIEINLSRKILFFHSRSVFLIDLKKNEDKILNQFLQIGAVDLERDFPEKLTISIEEREPAAIFEEGEGLFFVDEEGIIFEKVSEKDNWLIIKNPNFGKEPKLGEEAVDKEKIPQILKIQSGLKELNIEIVSTEIVNQQRMNIKTSEGWEIYFNSRDDVSQQVFNLDLVLKKKISPEERRNLEYVDLRFSNQVYYK